MFERWTFGKRLAVGFGLAGLTLLLIAGSAYLSTRNLIENDDWVIHTHAVRSDLADLTLALINAETGQRGFIITGNDSYLEPYRMGLVTIKTTLDDVRKLTSDNPVEQQRWSSLAPLIDAKMAELQRTIDLRKTQGFEAAAKVVVGNEGKIIMDQIRAIIAQADQEEATLLEQRNAEAKSSARWAMAIILWGGLVGIGIVAVIGARPNRAQRGSTRHRGRKRTTDRRQGSRRARDDQRPPTRTADCVRMPG